MTAMLFYEHVEVNLPSFTASNAALGVLGLTLLYIFFVKVIYNLFFHPLRNYPGPKLWAISRLPWNYVNLKGRISWRIRELHEQYGSVVRIAPDELSYTTSTAWKKIYGQRSPEFDKALDGRGIAPASINGRRSLMTETTERHPRLRRAILPAFSERALREQEHYLQGHSDNFITQLKKRCREGPVDLMKWYNLVVFDIVSDLAFGEPAGCLDNADQPWIQVLLTRDKAVVYLQLAVQYGLASLLSWVVPRHVTEARRKHLALTEAKVHKRIKAKNAGKDFMSYILDNETEKLSNIELVMLASNFIAAGSGTSSAGMSGLTYLLLRNPDKMTKLRAEIRTAFRSSDEITMAATAHCKYLSACIDEGLRLYPPTPGSLPRFVPGKGEVIDGRLVAGGMAVSVHQFSAGHSESNFKRAAEFVPERWLELEDGSEFSGDDRSAAQPFSYGQRSCVGKAMAYAEMRLIVAKLLWHFDLGLENGEDDWWGRQGTYLVWEKLPLMVHLHPRVESADF